MMCQSFPIAEVSIGNRVILGFTACPGRKNPVETDVKTLEDWGATALISLVEGHEFSSLGVADFSSILGAGEMRWFHLPIADMSIPGDDFNQKWQVHGGEVLQIMQMGGRLIVHCAAGLGRSGMIAAKLLAVFGVPPGDAIAKVRLARPGAIETRVQEDYVLTGSGLADLSFGFSPGFSNNER